MKKILCSAPLLTHFNPSKTILVEVYVSPYGMRAVMEDGSEKLICYISQALSNAEQNYAHIRKEGSALNLVMKKLHQYLYWNCFTIFTHNKLLFGLFTEYKPIPSLAAARVQCRVLFLAAYNYKLKYYA